MARRKTTIAVPKKPAKSGELVGPAASQSRLATTIAGLFGTEGLQITTTDVQDIFISDFLALNLSRQDAATQQHARWVEEAHQAETEAEELMLEDANNRAEAFKASQSAALRTMDVPDTDVEYSVTASPDNPPAKQGKARNGPPAYAQYTYSVTVKAPSACKNWSGSFTLSRSLALPKRAIELLQKRDAARAEAAKYHAETKQLKREESDGPARLRMIVAGAVARCRIESVAGGEELIQAVQKKAQDSALLRLTYTEAT